MPTPYDGKVAVWFVYGGMVGEATIDEIANTLKTYAPAVNAVFVKVTDGTDWMGKFDSASHPKPDLAINGPDDIKRWVTKLARYKLEFHAWALPKGADPDREAELLSQVCQQAGVQSLILDVEPYDGFFRGGRAAIGPLMSKLRGSISSDFHIGMSVDPRPNHYDEVFPGEWSPFVNSIHPQVYWGEFGQSPDAALQATYSTWGKYGKPIFPVLQAYNVTRATMDTARSLAVRTYNASGVSWYVFGAMGWAQFPAVNVPLTNAGTSTGDGGSTPVFKGQYGTEIIVTPDCPSFQEGTFDNAPSPLQSFRNTAGWTSKFVQTQAKTSTAWVRWDPQLPTGGFWEISAYIPSQHATSTRARFKVHGIVDSPGEEEVIIAQSPRDDVWVSLGVYNFVSGDPTAGVMFLNDLTGEDGVEIAFDAIRWRQVLGIPNPPPYLADGFDAPLGSDADRKLAKLWPGIWYTHNGFETFYYLGPGNTNAALHTGDDLMLHDPATGERQDAAHQPIFAIADGVVTSASQQAGTWGNVIVIQHDPFIGTSEVVFSRYGHVENVQVKTGDRVVRGQHIANVGNSFGRFLYHLHFDISPTRTLQLRPWDWPGVNKKRLEADYVDPYIFIQNHRPAKP